MAGSGESRGGQEPALPAVGAELRPWWPPLAASLAAYLALALAARAVGADLPGSVSVGLPFLFLPILYLRWRRLPLRFGAFSWPFVFSVASYAPFAAWAALAAPGSEWFYRSLASTVTAFPAVVFWGFDTFLHVGAVDYFTKRVVQFEAELRFGVRRALAIQTAVWSLGHVVEWFWLRLLLGDAGAAVFLVSAGLVTGLAYQRWKNALGLMAGHFLVNVTAAAYSAFLFA